MQTQIANAVEWAEKEFSVDSYGAFFPSSIERLSFAGLQPVSGKLFFILFILYSICDICFCCIFAKHVRRILNKEGF